MMAKSKQRIILEDIIVYLVFISPTFIPVCLFWLILLPFPGLRKPIDRFLGMWRWD